MTIPSPIENILIRPMEPEDLEQAREIDRLSFTLPWPATAFRYELYENHNSLLWVAEHKNGAGSQLVVGVLVIWLILDEAHIATISIHPDYRRRGIAQPLLATGLAAAIRHGATLATLEVRASNLAAQMLYRRFRFEVVGERIRYYKDNNENALIMTVNNLSQEDLNWLASGGWLADADPQE